MELKRELVLGELRRARMAAFSIAASLGGMLVPAALYLTLQLGREGGHGWGTVMATEGNARRGGLLAGIGFTVALFIANLAFDDALINAAKLGIFSASVVSAAAVLAWATRGKPVRLG